jgi:hypothetical protein
MTSSVVVAGVTASAQWFHVSEQDLVAGFDDQHRRIRLASGAEPHECASARFHTPGGIC